MCGFRRRAGPATPSRGTRRSSPRSPALPTRSSLPSVLALVHLSSEVGLGVGARSVTRATAPGACSPARIGRSASASGLHRRRRRRTRVHAKAELRAGRHNGWTVDDAPCPEIGESQVRTAAAAKDPLRPNAFLLHSVIGGASGRDALALAGRPFHKPTAGSTARPRWWRSRRTPINSSYPIEQMRRQDAYAATRRRRTCASIAATISSPARAVVLARANAALSELVPCDNAGDDGLRARNHSQGSSAGLGLADAQDWAIATSSTVCGPAESEQARS